MAELSQKGRKPYILSFVAACSDSGKTTLIEKLVIILKGLGYKIGVLKHSAHKVEMDQKGKDSFRFTSAGADEVIVSSRESIGMIRTLREELELERILNLFEDVDIVLIEGYKNSGYPKIEVHRQCMDSTLLCSENRLGIIAVASDEKLKVDCEVLDLNDKDRIASWIAERAEKFFNTDRNIQHS